MGTTQGLSVTEKSRLINGIVLAALLLVLAGGTVVLGLYEYRRLQFGDDELPGLNAVSEATRQLASVQFELLILVQDSQDGLLSDEDIYPAGKGLLDRVDTLLQQTGARDYAPARLPGVDVTTFSRELQAYRSHLVTTVEMLSVNPALANAYASKAELAALAVNQGANRLQAAIRTAMSGRDQTLRQTLLYFGLPFTLVLLASTFFLFRVVRRLGHDVDRLFGATRDALARLGERRTEPVGLDGFDTPEGARIHGALENMRHALLELDAIHADLENQVAERTRQLIQANVGLADRLELLARTERSLRLYKQTFDSAGEGMLITDLEGRVVDVNPSYCAITGHDREALLGRPTQAFQSDNQDKAFYWAMWREILGKGRWSGELLDRRGNGESYPVWLSIGTVSDQTGRPTNYVGVVTDISERKRVEDALRKLNEELEERVVQRTAQLSEAKDEAERANRAKSEFLSRMSHELRTPLNAILGFGQLLEMDVTDPSQADSVREILRAGNHLLELIGEVLDMSRIESGNLKVNLEPLLLMDLVNECLALVRTQAQARKIDLVAPACATDHLALADPVRLRQVVINLLSNAIKYNSPEGRVMVSCVAQGESLRLSVIDTGPGLSAEEMARLFKPFERLDADRRGVDGTGIGLALSKRLMLLMDGEIGVDSAPGEGSTFWLRIPRADAF